MDLEELQKMTVPKLRERAKEITDLQGVGGMKKEELIQAIAKAEGIAVETEVKDESTISSVKQEIRVLKKQKEELLASPEGRSKVKQIRRKIKRLKRRTRKLAQEAARLKAIQQPQAESAPPASGAPPTPEAPPASEAPPAPETPPAPEAPPTPETPPAPAG